MDFSHVGIVVQDMQESVDFYCKVLGCKVHRQQLEGNPQFTLLKGGEQKVELLHFSDDSKERKEGVISHLAFKVENIEEEITRLKQLGIDLLSEQPREIKGGMKMFFFTGPSGESIEFVQVK